jgi:hypothetical protein
MKIFSTFVLPGKKIRLEELYSSAQPLAQSPFNIPSPSNFVLRWVKNRKEKCHNLPKPFKTVPQFFLMRKFFVQCEQQKEVQSLLFCMRRVIVDHYTHYFRR